LRQLSNEPEQFPVSKLNASKIGRRGKENQGIVEERKIGIENQSKRMERPRQLELDASDEPLSPREKIPFEVAPADLHLMRHMESSAEVEHSSAVPGGNSGRRSGWPNR
jgi:hypothetical protein